MSSVPTGELQVEIRSFIEYISGREEEPPKTRIIEICGRKTDNTEASRSYKSKEKFVNHPSKKYPEYRSEMHSHFEDLAADNTCQLSNLEVHKKSETYGQLAWKVMDYVGDFGYSDSAFQSVIEDTLQSDDQQYSQYRVIIPLLNFGGDFESVELTNNEADVLPHQQNRFPIETLRIREVHDDLLSAIMTYEGYPGVGFNEVQPSSLFYSLPSYCIEIELQSDLKASFNLLKFGGYETVSQQLTMKANNVADRISTTLHLYDSNSAPHTGLPYIVYDDWRSYRQSINSRDIYRHFFDGYSPTLSNPSYNGTTLTVQKESISDVADFWERYGELVSHSDYEEAIYRLDQMFQNHSYPETVIDAAIAYESLFRKGADWGSLATTIALQGSILLSSHHSYNRKDIWNFFKATYDARSKIVHGGENWEDIVSGDKYEFSILDDEHPSSQDVAQKNREVLAQSILAYMDHFTDYGYSVGRVNESIFDQIRDSEYVPN